MRNKLTIIIVTIAVLSSTAYTAEKINPNVLTRWIHWSDASTLLRHHLNQQAFDYLDQREQAIKNLHSAQDWQWRQQHAKQTLLDILGPFPEKTPLNAQITDTIQKEGFRVEKIYFESMPQFYVTGCLFIPDGLNGKAPAILNVIGHTGIAFRAPSYQQVILNLVNKGFIVFAMDPLGQGERLQYYDAEKKDSVVGGPTTEHSHFGRQNFLNGISSARYFTWDGIRAIDYLLTRDEVDPERIGVTGISGGGTQTSYISAVDERVAVAAPTCYITSFRRLLQSIGPQDAEQNFYQEISRGLDHADFIEIRAPKPTLIIATTSDFFSIQGARETYREVQQAYHALGKPDHIAMAEDDHDHGYTKKTREALYAFMQKHLNNPGDPTDQELPTLSQEELTVTKTGQVLTALDSKRVFDYNLRETETNIKKLQKQRENFTQNRSKIIENAKTISGYQAPSGLAESMFLGAVQYEDYRLEKYVIHSEGRLIIPMLLFVPNTGGKHPAVLCLHPEGKQEIAQDGELIKKLIDKGFVVALPDLSGLGEVGNAVSGINSPFTCLLIGRSLPGLHAGEIVRAFHFLQTHEKVDAESIKVIAKSHLAPALLHAAAFEPSLPAIALIQPLISYEAVATTMLYSTPIWTDIPGILLGYDLPDLAASIAPRPLLIISPVDANLEVINESKANEVYQTAINQFQESKNLQIITGIKEGSELESALSDWLDD